MHRTIANVVALPLSHPTIAPALEVISRSAATGYAQRTPIVFVHGGWHAAWCWEKFSAFFAQHGYCSHAFSFRGHGKSEGRNQLKLHRIRDYVSDLRRVIESMREPPIVIAHSLGAFVAQHYLAQHGESRLKSVVLLTPVSPQGLWRVTLRVAIGYPWRFVRVHLTWSLWPIINRPELARDFLFSSAMPDSEVRRLHENLQDESYLAFIDGLILDLPKRPAELSIPRLVLGASEDKIITPMEVGLTGEALRTQPVIIPKIAHDMMLEPNWHVPANYILEFLRLHEMP